MPITEPPIENLTPPEPLSSKELAILRAQSAAGVYPTLDILRRVIHTIRKNWSAKPVEKTSGKSRVAKEKIDEKQIDFF